MLHPAQADPTWPARLKRLVFLGTPHHGASLERVGKWVDAVLDKQAITRAAGVGQALKPQDGGRWPLVPPESALGLHEEPGRCLGVCA